MAQGCASFATDFAKWSKQNQDPGGGCRCPKPMGAPISLPRYSYLHNQTPQNVLIEAMVATEFRKH